MAQQMRLHKQIERLLKRGELDEIAPLVWQDALLHEMDKRQKQTVGQLLANSVHFDALVPRMLDGGLSPDADFGDVFAPMSLLRVCLFKGNAELACEVIRRGARLDLVSKGGLTYAHDAALEQMPDVLRTLHEYGGDVESRSADDSEGNATPLHMACQLGAAPCVTVLLECGCDVELRNHRGESALQIAVKGRHEPLTTLLLAHGAQVNVSKLTGRTPLHEAVNRRQSRLTALLITHGARLDDVDDHGFSALHLASARGDVESVQLLCALGANRDLGTAETCRIKGAEVLMGSTPQDVARSCGQNRVVEVLEQQEWQGVSVESVLSAEHHP